MESADRRPAPSARRTALSTAAFTGLAILAAAAAAFFAGGSDPVIDARAPDSNSEISELAAGSSAAVAPTDAPGETAPASEALGPTVTVATTTQSTISLSPSSPPCPAADGSSPRTTSFTVAPPICTDPDATYRAVITTSEGVIEVELELKSAPIAANNFVYLARYKFYDGLTFHKAIPGFIIQGGDPLGNSRGGPGYEFVDELPREEGYPVGALAMAGGGKANPNSNGSQFFIAAGPLAKNLEGYYSRFGRVVNGTRVVKRINALGPNPDLDSTGTLTTPVTIESIRIVARGEKNIGASTTTAAPPGDSSTTTSP